MLETIKFAYTKYESVLSKCALALGFIVDNLTLRRVDFLAENLVFVTYLLIAGSAIVVLNYIQNKPDTRQKEITHFVAFLAVQFAIGGLFSGFLVFYGRGSSLEASFPFLVFLGALMLANEFLKSKYKARTFQILVFYVGIFAFLIFAFPVLLKNISPWVFLLSGLTSLVIVTIFGRLLFFVSKSTDEKERNIASISVWSVFIFINILYFFGFIPPLPLYVKDSGVFHAFSRQKETYIGLEEKRSIEDMLSFKQVFSLSSGAPNTPYVFTAVYSPFNLDAKIIHDWQYKDPKEGWKNMAKVETTLVGGRSDGYRIYSFYSNPQVGLWRVDAKTTRGQVLGRVRFEVVESNIPPILREVKK